jgi:uncharacterized protein (TIGR03435 family)
MTTRLSVTKALALLIASLLTAVRAAPEEKRVAFEVASVKPDTSGSGMVMIRPPVGGRFTATNARVKMLVSLAYKLPNFAISGGPGWIDTDGFDIEAKAADPKVSIEEMRPMLQSLLEDRFQLKVRIETREVPVYAITLPKGPARLPEAKEGGCREMDPSKPLPPPPPPGQFPPTPCGGFFMGPNHLEGGKISMTQLVNALTNILGQPVIDKSGFTGTFDVKLDFTAEGTAFRAGPAPAGLPAPNFDNSGPTIFTALQDVLGVKLESTKGPQETLYIDHVEKPSEN